MKTWIKASISLFFLLTFSISVHAEGLKIGVVDFQRALNEVPEGKNAKARLKSEFQAKKKSLEVKQNELKAMKDSLQQKALTLSKEALIQKENEFRQNYAELQKTLMTYQQEMATKEAEMTKNIIIKLKNTVAAVGQQEGYAMIFEKSQDSLLYAPNAVDLTSKVIAQYK